MRLAQALLGGQIKVVEQREGDWFRVDFDGDLVSLVAARVDLAKLSTDEQVPDAEILAPLAPGKIIAIGLNYMDHVRETGMAVPTSPLVFTKFPSSVIGPDASIKFDRAVTERVDWEVELAVVVGKTAQAVSREQALEYVFGYTACNDVSARDLQFGDGQWVRGKSLDTFCPLGPVVVTVDEIPDPQALNLQTRVNGETVQDSNTSEMIFKVDELVAFCSRHFTLQPGDLILSGTPWGCGEFTDPKRSLSDGDVVEVEVENIGVIRNRVVEFSG